MHARLGDLNASGVLFDAKNLKPASENIAFTSMWDYFPSNVSVGIPVAAPGDVVFALVAGSTNPMQVS